MAGSDKVGEDKHGLLHVIVTRHSSLKGKNVESVEPRLHSGNISPPTLLFLMLLEARLPLLERFSKCFQRCQGQFIPSAS